MTEEAIDIIVYHAYSLIEAGQYDQANSLFEEMLQCNPNNVKLLRNWGTALVTQEQYLQAFEKFEFALKIAPDDITTLNRYIQALNKAERYEEAIDAFEKALEIELNNVITLNGDANLLSKSIKYEEAIKATENRLEIKSYNASILSLILTIYTKILIKLERYEEAVSAFEKCLELDLDNDGIALAIYANLLSRIGRYEESISAFKKALEVEPNNVITLATYANLLSRIGRYEESISAFKRALEVEPNNVITLRGCASFFKKTGRYKEGIVAFKIALKLEPNNVGTLRDYAVFLTEIGRYKKAICFLKKALEIEPNNIIILFGYGNLLTKAGRYKEAISAFEQICIIFEKLSYIKTNNYSLPMYALSLEHLGQYKKAISYLETIELKQLNQYYANVVRITLGRLYYAIKERQKGNQYFQDALYNSTDKEGTLLYSASSILANDPYSPEAVQMLKQITEDSPRYALAYQMLILNLDEKGYFEMFATDLENSLNDTEMLNRGIYHKILNEINILKSIAYRILRFSNSVDPLLTQIVEEIEHIVYEISARRDQQKEEIESISNQNYEDIIQIISKTAHDISDFVNNQLAILESKTRRAMRKMLHDNPHYSQFEKLLNQLEYTQNALNDLKAVNQGIKIRKKHFKVKDLFEKWVSTPKLENASIYLDIRNGESEFNGDQEKIKSALNELVENSIKHNTEKSDLKIYIISDDVINPSGIRGITMPGEQKYLFIEFIDNGQGVPEDKKDWIFQPLKTTAKEGKGSGLGLFIIRKTLAQMKGYIMESGTNGVNFEIYIPY